MIRSILAFLALSARAQDIDFAHENGIIQPNSWNLAKGKFENILKFLNFWKIRGVKPKWKNLRRADFTRIFLSFGGTRNSRPPGQSWVGNWPFQFPAKFDGFSEHVTFQGDLKLPNFKRTCGFWDFRDFAYSLQTGLPIRWLRASSSSSAKFFSHARKFDFAWFYLRKTWTRKKCA